MRDGKRAVDTNLKDRAGNVVLLPRKGLLPAIPLLDERTRYGKAEVLGQVGRSADGENCAALLEEAAQLRNRLRHRHAPHPRPPVSRHRRGVERAAAPT